MTMTQKIAATFALVLTLALASCAGAAPTWENNLGQLVGKPANDADIFLRSHPTGDYAKGDARVYVWQGHNTESIFGPSVTRGSGLQIGRATSLGTEFYLSGIQYDTCVVKATVLDGIIREIHSEGSAPAGCREVYGKRHRELGSDPHNPRR